MRIVSWMACLLVAQSVLAKDVSLKGPSLEIDAYRLSNGLKVALHRDASVPRVVVCVAYHVGSKNERAGRTGFAHFFEHMMFRGTKNVPDYDVPLQETGAQSNAFTNEDMTVYFEVVSSEYLERALYQEAERLAFLPTALDQSKFDTEREIVKNERRQGVDNVPYGFVEEALLSRVFPKGHPYSWSVIGSMKDLDAASLDDLKDFFAEFYVPSNATLCLVGDFDPAEAKGWIARYFEPLKPGTPPSRRPAPAAKATSADLELADEVNLPRIHWAWPTVGDDHPDAPALDLLSIVLAGGETSRLHKVLVRDRRLAKDVSARSETREVGGLFTLESTAAEGKPIAEIEDVLRAEVARLKSEPPTKGELDRALARLETRLYTGLTRPTQRAFAIGMGYAQKDDPHHYRKEFARYFEVRPDDVRDAASRYLPDEKVRLLVRPVKPGEAKSQVTPGAPEPDASRGDLGQGRKGNSSNAPISTVDWSKLPGPSRPSGFRPPAITRSTLKDGIAVWAAPWRTLPLIQLSLQIPVGSGDDPAGREGLASLMARLLDQGTEKRTATELTEEFERLGASVHVSAGRDDTTISLGVLARNFQASLDLLAEMLVSPRFDAGDFERERARQLADLLQGPEDVNWLARRVLPIVMYGADHPHGKPLEGYTETVKHLTREDLRSFHREGIGPKGAVLVVAGDVELSELQGQLDRSLGNWTAKNVGARGRPDPKKANEGVRVLLVDKPGAVQSVISIGRHWVERRDPQYLPARVGNFLFGEDFLGRLNKNLRVDHGYSYGAGSGFSFRRGRSTWNASTSVRDDATVPALSEILKEMDEVAGPRPITEEEVRTSKAADSRSFPAEFESPAGIVGALSELAEFDLPNDTLERFLPELDRVKLEDVQRVMTTLLLPSERYIVIVGNCNTLIPELKKAGYDQLRIIGHDGKPVEP